MRSVSFDEIARADWDRLVSLTPAATPFARWTFHRAWWDAYGSTAHEQYMAAFDPRAANPETLRAIVPLMHRHAQEPDDLIDRTILRRDPASSAPLPAEFKVIFFGASYHADYATILADPADLPAVSAALAESLLSDTDSAAGSQRWDAVDLRRLRSVDQALDALEMALRSAGAGWQVRRQIEDVCPVITVPGPDWDEYLATLDKKARHEIRRKLRRAGVVGDLSIEIAPPTPESIDAFIRLHDLRFGDGGLFASNAGGERSRAFVHRLAELELAEPEGGQLHVGIVRCGRRPVFAVLAFDDGERCWLYNAGIDPAAAEASPGVTGTAVYLRDRMAAGRRRFDFLRGNEPYKYEWGALDEPIEQLLVLRSAS